MINENHVTCLMFLFELVDIWWSITIWERCRWWYETTL